MRIEVPIIDPWDRQQGETSKAYEAFSTYRDLGSQRSTRRVAEALSKSETIINRWSSQHNWVERARAWDSIPAQATAQAYADMAREAAQAHQRLANKLIARLERNLDGMPEGMDPSIKWSTAHGAARQGHQLATDLSKPAQTRSEEITKAIENLLGKLAGE